MEEANKYDKAVTNAQKDDANGVLVFVSYNLPIMSSVEVTGFKDWSLLRSRGLVHCRKLQKVIPRLWRHDNGYSQSDITTARRFTE